MHIGLIGGIGPAATEYYDRGLIERHTRAEIPLELTIAHAEVRDLAQTISLSIHLGATMGYLWLDK
jgi:aspartate racemase